MPVYRVWHGECDTCAEAKEITAESIQEVAKGLLFVYYAGDCDHGATEIRMVPGERWIALREGSPDYFFIELQKENP